MIRFANVMAAYLFASLLVIILLHFLTRRQQQVVVSSTILWKNMRSRTSQLAVRFRPRVTPLLLLQLLVAAILVTALMQPQLLGGWGPRQVVIVVDDSASMQATDVSPNRFQVAVNKAVERIQNLSGASIAIATAGKPRLVQDFTTDKERLVQSVKSIAPGTGEADFGEAVGFAQSLLREPGRGQILYFTDGASTVGELPVVTSTEVVQVGSSDENIGIIGLAAQKGLRGRFDIMVTVANFSDSPSTVPLQVSREGAIVEEKTALLSAGESTEVFFSVPVKGQEEFRVSQGIKDNLPLDDAAWVTLGRPALPRVLLVTPGNFFLERGLLSYPGIRAFVRETPDDLSAYDLVVFDGVPPAAAVDRGLYIDVLPYGVSGESAKVVDRPLIIADSYSTHPLLNLVDLQGLKVSGYRPLMDVSGLVPLVIGTEGPVVAAHEGTDKWVYVGFDLNRSSLPLQVGFPVLLGNIIDWMLPEAVRVGPIVSAVEADIEPKWAGEIMQSDNGEMQAQIRSGLWFHLTLAALLLILGEWLLWLKRLDGHEGGAL